MPQPTQKDVHIDSVLTNISVAYMQAQQRFIAPKVFPVIPVKHQSDKYFVYTKGDWFRDEAQLRADATESMGSGYNLGTDNYSAEVYAFHKDIGAQARANADAAIDLDRDAAQFVVQRLLIRNERKWQEDFFATSKWATDVTPTNKWDDFVDGDPVEDIEDGKETILSTTGLEANTLVVGYQVHRRLKQHPDVRDQYRYTTAEAITEDMLARFFGVDNYYVSKAVYNAAAEGAADNFSFIMGKHALLLHVPENPGTLVPAAGYTFAWDGVSMGMGESIGTKRFEIPQLGPATRVESEIAFDNKIVGSDLGYFFNAAVS